MKRILVTGADGFIGKKLCAKLANHATEVIQLSISDGDLSLAQPDVPPVDWIIHLAGVTYVPASWEDPALFYRVNVMSTANILEVCRRNQCGLTFMSTYVYGTPQYLPIDEDHPINPNSPYNHSKYLAEELCRFYHHAFDIPVVIYRPFNIYGPGQANHFVIPVIMEKLFDNNQKDMVLMDLDPQRDFIHVDDVVDALILSMGLDGLRTYNLASGKLISIRELAKLMMEISGIKKELKSQNLVRKNEVSDILASIEKIQTELGWKPKVDIRSGLQRLISEMSV